MKGTKKVKSTGRFGARYGVGVKKRVLKVEEKQKEAVSCPFCGFKRIKRKAAGLFVCRKCGARFTGGAYVTETLAGKTIKKMISQRTFLADAAELIKNTEKEESSYSEIEKEVSKSIKHKEKKNRNNVSANEKEEIIEEIMEEEKDTGKPKKAKKKKSVSSDKKEKESDIDGL